MSSERCGSRSIRLASRSTSTLGRTKRFASSSSLSGLKLLDSDSNRLTNAPVGSLRSVYLVVNDPEGVGIRLLERGVDGGEIRRKTPIILHRVWSKSPTFHTTSDCVSPVP